MIIIPDKLLDPWRTKGIPFPRNLAAGDASYFCPTKDLVNNELYPNFRKWLASLNLGKWYHKWDCDNFADAFKVFSDGYYFNYIESDAESISIGIIHFIAQKRAENGTSGPHAGNLIYLNDGNNNMVLSYFEPQNGKLYDLTEEEFKSIRFLYV